MLCIHNYRCNKQYYENCPFGRTADTKIDYPQKECKMYEPKYGWKLYEKENEEWHKQTETKVEQQPKAFNPLSLIP